MAEKETPCRIIADIPVPEIDDNDPFGFEPFVGSLASMATHAKNETPFAVIVDGPWGCGKTSMMEMTKKRIDDDSKKLAGEATEKLRPCKTFWFNAWKYSHEEHVLSSLLLLIMNGIVNDKTFSWNDARVSKESLMQGGIHQLFRKLTGFNISEIFNDIKVAEKTAFFDQFSDLLKGIIVEQFGEKSTKGAFVIFIDDLDRCPPNRVLDVLEAIKLFLDIPGCVFFLGMEVEQVKKLVAKAYSDYFKDGKEVENKPFDVDRYMEKRCPDTCPNPGERTGEHGQICRVGFERYSQR